jgi:hypothetical protein
MIKMLLLGFKILIIKEDFFFSKRRERTKLKSSCSFLKFIKPSNSPRTTSSSVSFHDLEFAH